MIGRVIKYPRSGLTIAVFSGAIVEVEREMVRSYFVDGRENVFYLSGLVDDAEYRRIATWAGYGADWQRYGREHELTHHWLAGYRGHSWSESLHDNPPMGAWPQSVADEEHLVNALQRFVMTGERDDDWGCLNGEFGRGLEWATGSLRELFAEAHHNNWSLPQ